MPQEHSTKRRRVLHQPRWNPVSHSALLQAIHDSATLLKEHSADFALAGGLAVQTHGHPRETHDVDWILYGEQGEQIRELLEDENPRAEISTLSFGGARARSGFSVPVDFISRQDDQTALYNDALSQARKQPRMRVAGVLVNVIDLEYLVAIKMAANRRQDQADVVALLSRAPVDRARLRRILKKHRIEDWEQELSLYELEARQRTIEREGKD